MEPRLHRQQRLCVITASPASCIVEVDGVPYYVTCWPRRDNPPRGGPLRPGQWVHVYNTPVPGGPTLVERLTPNGAGDGCTYLLRDYDRVVTERCAGQPVERPSTTASGKHSPPANAHNPGPAQRHEPRPHAEGSTACRFERGSALPSRPTRVGQRAKPVGEQGFEPGTVVQEPVRRRGRAARLPGNARPSRASSSPQRI
jgi:hypothetical protein